MSTEYTLVVFPTYIGVLFGVDAVRIRVRTVVVMMRAGGEVTLPRKLFTENVLASKNHGLAFIASKLVASRIIK
jgi:hypothetical protein